MHREVESALAKYKIGITEAGDAGLNLNWVQKLGQVDGAIVITKRITSDFFDAVLENRDKLIVHTTITGNGGTALEPNVPTWEQAFVSVNALVHAGFPKEKIVARVDPIIPDAQHIAVASNVICAFMSVGFTRYRISIIDMYPHVRNRFAEAGIPAPYGMGFSPSAQQSGTVDGMIRDVRGKFKELCGKPAESLRIEACAEPQLKNALHCGCVSAFDLALLGLDATKADAAGRQRKNCLCYSGKTELLELKRRYANACRYCYWQEIGG